MEPGTANLIEQRLNLLLRGEPEFLLAWTVEWRIRRVGFCVAGIIAGAGLYGAAMGSWRGPLQALFVAIKFPLIVLLTTVGNALLNAVLAPLLGLNISLRQSLLAVLMSFTIAAAILGSFSPLIAFLVWNAPAMTPDVRISGGTYSFIQLANVATIAFAGTIANLRLVQLLSRYSGGAAAARRVLLAWLAGNLFLGSQLAWILRPFIGSPNLPVEFLRASAFKGNFYETVFHAVLRLLQIN
jgi:hypothetical protein